MEQIAKGIWKVVFGEPEKYTPECFRSFPIKKEMIEKIPISRKPKIKEDDLEWKKTNRGVAITLPISAGEDIYGFGLQLRNFNQAGKMRYLKVNSDPVSDTGETHAPAPFYTSLEGYRMC